MIRKLISTSLLLTVVAMFSIAAVAKPKLIPRAGLQHDDHGDNSGPVQGTSSALCSDGVSSGFACGNISLRSRLELPAIGGGAGNDSWGWKDPDSGKYYALMARSNGVSFIDVSDPDVPVYLGNLPSEASAQPWRDVKTYNNHAFVVADNILGHGMQVFDLTRLRDATPASTFTPDATYKEFGPAHNIAINEATGFAYVAGSNTCNEGLHIVNIRNPQSPQFAGCFTQDGYTHDVHCAVYSGPDSEHSGKEICLASNEDSVTIIDVTNKSSPRMISKVAYPMIGYSHQGWLTEDQRYFLLGDELDERRFGINTRTLFFDLNNLDNPVYVGAHTASTQVIDHNLYIKDGYVYQANYQAGLRVFRLDDPATASMTEVAFFDTNPQVDDRNFDGAWNVYPFFDNNIVLVSDMSNGLFVLETALPTTGIMHPHMLNETATGAWVAEGQNDQGLLVYVDENATGPYIFWAWFSFLNGEPFWLVGNAFFEDGDSDVTTPAIRLDGLDFLQTDSFAGRQDIGTVSLHLHNCSSLKVTYDLGDLGSGEVTMSKLIGVRGQACGE